MKMGMNLLSVVCRPQVHKKSFQIKNFPKKDFCQEFIFSQVVEVAVKASWDLANRG